MRKQIQVTPTSEASPEVYEPDDQSDMTDGIRQRAFELWEKNGMPDGKHEEHWQQAQKDLEKGLREKM